MIQQTPTNTQVPALVNDLSELEQLLKQVPEMLRTKRLLVDTFEAINKKLLQGETYDNLLETVFEAIDPLIPFIRIGIALLEHGNEDVRLYWVKSKLPVRALKKNYVARLADSSLKKILDTGEPRIINDLEAYLRLHPGSESTELALQDGIRSSFTCPLTIEGKRLGFIFFSSMNTFTYEAVHKDIYHEIAAGLSQIIAHELTRSSSFTTSTQEAQGKLN